jgi:hypothetical protein
MPPLSSPDTPFNPPLHPPRPPIPHNSPKPPKTPTPLTRAHTHPHTRGPCSPPSLPPFNSPRFPPLRPLVHTPPTRPFNSPPLTARLNPSLPSLQPLPQPAFDQQKSLERREGKRRYLARQASFNSQYPGTPLWEPPSAWPNQYGMAHTVWSHNTVGVCSGHTVGRMPTFDTV